MKTIVTALGLLTLLWSSCTAAQKVPPLSSPSSAEKVRSSAAEKASHNDTSVATQGIRPSDDSRELVLDLLRSKPERFKAILDNADKYEVQILYTQINRTKNNEPSFVRHSFRVDPRRYFDPASLVKLPVVCLAFQKLDSLNLRGLDKHTHLRIGAHHHCQSPVRGDATSSDGYASIAHYAKKMLLVSDNDAYNRVYEFLGQEYIHTSLWKMGYTDARIIRRFRNCNAGDDRYTNPFVFFNDSGAVVYSQPLQVNPTFLSNPLAPVLKGRGYKDSNGRLIHKPFDFSLSNNLSLEDVQHMLMSVMFPQAFPVDKRFGLTNDDYRFLYTYLSMVPSESAFPDYKDTQRYPDNYKKYFIFGDAQGEASKIRDSRIRIFNVVGRSDGYLSDCAYIVDFDKKIEFFLAAVIYVNADEIMRDGKYEYETVGLPFLAELGRTIYAYETTRKRQFQPNLDTFEMK